MCVFWYYCVYVLVRAVFVFLNECTLMGVYVRACVRVCLFVSVCVCVCVCVSARARASVLGCFIEKFHKIYPSIYKHN